MPRPDAVIAVFADHPAAEADVAILDAGKATQLAVYGAAIPAAGHAHPAVVA
jgi:hypothetical protein